MSGGLAALKGQRVRTLEGDGVGIEDGGGALGLSQDAQSKTARFRQAADIQHGGVL